MKKITVELVEASEVFNGLPAAWTMFVEGSPDCSWGDNSRTLVRPEIIMDVLELEEDSQAEMAMKRLKELGDTYIDLEN